MSSVIEVETTGMPLSSGIVDFWDVIRTRNGDYRRQWNFSL
jgi:hypothetical protein